MLVFYLGWLWVIAGYWLELWYCCFYFWCLFLLFGCLRDSDLGIMCMLDCLFAGYILTKFGFILLVWLLLGVGCWYLVFEFISACVLYFWVWVLLVFDLVVWFDFCSLFIWFWFSCCLLLVISLFWLFCFYFMFYVDCLCWWLGWVMRRFWKLDT